MGDLKFTMLGNTATHMPQGLGGLPGMTAMATHQMKKSIEEIGVPEVPEFLQQIVDSGGHLWACRMSADMQHLEAEDLYDEVEAHHQRLRLHREDRRRAAALHLARCPAPSGRWAIASGSAEEPAEHATTLAGSLWVTGAPVARRDARP